MRVFVTGATGVIGSRAVAQLAAAGHEVDALVRDDRAVGRVEEWGGTPHRGDVLETDSLSPAADADAVLHAATAIPTETKPPDAAWERNDAVRRQGARNLLDAAGDLEQFVFPSVVWLARPPDGSAFDETGDRHPDRATRSAAQVEALLADAASEREFDAAVLRLGFLYAHDAAHTRQFGEGVLDGSMPAIGGGVLGRREPPLSYLHADDAGRAVAAAVDAGLDGTYHVVDEESASVAAFLSALADRLDASEPRRVPRWLARFLVGESAANMLGRPTRTTSERFRAATDWTPAYPTYRAGLDQVVDAWLAEGTLRETPEGYEWAGEGSEAAEPTDHREQPTA